LDQPERKADIAKVLNETIQGQITAAKFSATQMQAKIWMSLNLADFRKPSLPPTAVKAEGNIKKRYGQIWI